MQVQHKIVCFESCYKNEGYYCFALPSPESYYPLYFIHFYNYISIKFNGFQTISSFQWNFWVFSASFLFITLFFGNQIKLSFLLSRKGYSGTFLETLHIMGFVKIYNYFLKLVFILFPVYQKHSLKVLSLKVQADGVLHPFVCTGTTESCITLAVGVASWLLLCIWMIVKPPS